jgi:hypothetical protein
MRHRALVLADGLVVVGVVLGVIGLMAISGSLTERTAIPGAPAALRTSSTIAPQAPLPALVDPPLYPCAVLPEDRGMRGTAVAGSSQPRTAAATSFSTSSQIEDNRGDGDARTYLQEAAAAARHAGAPPGETRTELWINAPASIGSTSPPPASPVMPPGEE